MPTVAHRLLRLLFCTAVSACILTVGGGCQALAAVLDKTADPVEKAQYVPEKDNMLILVENYQNPGLVEIVADHMNRLIAEELIAHKVAPIVNPDRLNAYRSEHLGDFRKMRTEAIGLELGAMQVLYVNITEFTVESVPSTELHKGHAVAQVVVRDTRTALPRWPKDAPASGYQVIVDIPFATENPNTSDTAVRSAMARELSARISRLFYDAVTNQPNPTPSYPESGMR